MLVTVNFVRGITTKLWPGADLHYTDEQLSWAT